MFKSIALAILLLSTTTAFAQAQKLSDFGDICKNTKSPHECEAKKAKVYNECTRKNMYVGGYNPTCIEDGMRSIVSSSFGTVIPKDEMVGSRTNGVILSPSSTLVGTVNVAPHVLLKEVERIPPERAKEYRIQGAKKAALELLNRLRHTTTQYDVALSALNKELAVAGITLDELEKWEKDQLEAEKKAIKGYWKIWLHQWLPFN